MTVMKDFFQTPTNVKFNPKIFETLATVAHDIEGDGRTRVVSAVVHRHRNIVSVGFNSRHSHPFQLRYGRNSDSIYWHAETHAIYNALRREPISTLEKCSLYIVRLKKPFPKAKTWIPGMTKPCAGCASCIRAHGIEDVIYTTDTQIIQEKYTCN
jgi:tRNA(Arg) A34 adenosine deaminase TadA